MADLPTVAWCTNVHDATTVAQLGAAIGSVADRLSGPGAVGLWLSPQMLQEHAIAHLRELLERRELTCIGLNGFPAMAFREVVVKTDVYRPAWDDPDRLDYTLLCARALLELLPEGGDAGITTLPIGWSDDGIDAQAAANMLRQACVAVDRIGADARRGLHIAIEPEPGCMLNTTAAAAEFVRQHDLVDLTSDGLLRICLDTCHMAVQHEDILKALDALDDVHMKVGRVQVSSAPQADLPDDEALAALSALAEPRWMHQTTVHDGAHRHDYQDLPPALDDALAGNWRTHLHVPVHLQSMGPLQTTQRLIIELLRALAVRNDRPPLEVETYAWSVVPKAHRSSDLVEDIQRELQWTAQTALECGW